MAHRPSPRALTEFFAQHTGLARVGTYDQMKEKLKAAGLGIDFNPSYAMNLILDEDIKFWAYTQVQVLPVVGQNGIFYITPDSQMWIWNEKEQTYDPAGGISAIDDDISLTSRNPVQNKVITNKFQKGPFIIPSNTGVDFKDIKIGDLIPVNISDIKTVDGGAIKSTDATKGTIIVDKYGNIAIVNGLNGAGTKASLRVVTKTEKGSETSSVFLSRDFLTAVGTSATHKVLRNRLYRLGSNVIPEAEEITPNKSFLVDYNGEMALVTSYDSSDGSVYYEKFLGFPTVLFCTDKYASLSTTIGDITQIDPYYFKEYRANSVDSIPSSNASQLVPGRTMIVDAFGTVGVFAYKDSVTTPTPADRYYFRTLATTGDKSTPIYRSKAHWGTGYDDDAHYDVYWRWQWRYNLQKLQYNGSEYVWTDCTSEDYKNFIPGKTLAFDSAGELAVYNGGGAMGGAIMFFDLTVKDITTPTWSSPVKLANRAGDSIVYEAHSSTEPDLSPLITRVSAPQHPKTGDLVVDSSGTIGVITRCDSPYSSTYHAKYTIRTLATSDVGILGPYQSPVALSRRMGNLTVIDDEYLGVLSGLGSMVQLTTLSDYENRLVIGKSLYVDGNGSIGVYAGRASSITTNWVTISSSSFENGPSTLLLKSGTISAQPNVRTVLPYISSPEINIAKLTAGGWVDVTNPSVEIAAGDLIVDMAGTVAKVVVLGSSPNEVPVVTIFSTQALGVIIPIESRAELLKKEIFATTEVDLSTGYWVGKGKRESGSWNITVDSLVPGASLLVDRDGSIGVFSSWEDRTDRIANFVTLSTSGEKNWVVRTTSFLTPTLNAECNIPGDALQYDKPNDTPDYDGYTWWKSTPTYVNFEDMLVGKTVVFDKYGVQGTLIAKTSNGAMNGFYKFRITNIGSPMLYSSSRPLVQSASYSGGYFHEDGIRKTVTIHKNSITNYNDTLAVHDNGAPLLVTCSDHSIVRITDTHPGEADVEGVVINSALDMIYNPSVNAGMAFSRVIGERTTYSTAEFGSFQKRSSYNNVWNTRSVDVTELITGRTLAYDRFGTVAILVGKKDANSWDFETIFSTYGEDAVTTDRTEKTLKNYTQIFRGINDLTLSTTGDTTTPISNIRSFEGNSAVNINDITLNAALVTATNGIGQIKGWSSSTSSVTISPIITTNSSANTVTTTRTDKTLQTYAQIVRADNHELGRNGFYYSTAVNPTNIKNLDGTSIDTTKMEPLSTLILCKNGIGFYSQTIEGSGWWLVETLFRNDEGGSNNINDPQTWEKNTWIDFGNDWHGYRFYGSTAATSAYNNGADGDAQVLAQTRIPAALLLDGVRADYQFREMATGGGGYSLDNGSNRYIQRNVNLDSFHSSYNNYGQCRVREAYSVNVTNMGYVNLSVVRQTGQPTCTSFHYDVWFKFKYVNGRILG